jgi:hypothetical protein
VQLNLNDQIKEALTEAMILECAREEYDEDHLLYVAQRLSGAPYSFIKEIHNKSKIVEFSY